MRRWWVVGLVLVGLMVAVWSGLQIPPERGESGLQIPSEPSEWGDAQQGEVITRPVVVRSVATVESEEAGGYRAILLGRVVDSVTRGEIAAQVMIESAEGAVRAGNPFTVTVPTMSAITLTVVAPGYEMRQEVMRARYRRDVTLTVEIPLQAVTGPVD